MKCPRCGLQNLEHVKLCVKCGRQLVGVSLPEDFSSEPSRAGWFNPVKKLYWKWRRSRRIILPENGYEVPAPLWKRLSFSSFYYGEPVPGSLLAMLLSFLLPGTGQFFLGRRLRGLAFLLPGLLALLTFILAMYNYLINTLNLAASVYLVFQCISVFDAMPRIRATRASDWLVNIFLAATVWLGCYVSINIALTYATDYFQEGVRTIRYNFPYACAIHNGDTVLIRKQDTYARGNIVMYTCSVPYRYGHRTGWNNHYLNIDRVIGLPGETVSVKNGLVSINSAVPENQEKLTLQPRKIPDMQWTLGTDEYFIFTSAINIPAVLLKPLSRERKAMVVNINNITGRITRIVSPLDRRGNL